jgi:hypothetical protein
MEHGMSSDEAERRVKGRKKWAEEKKLKLMFLNLK